MLSAFVVRFELALQQNEITDVFFDDWMNLGEDDGTFGTKADNHLKVRNLLKYYKISHHR